MAPPPHRRALLLALALLPLVLAGCTGPKEPLNAATAAGADPALPPGEDPGAPSGGGLVLNAAPRVVDFQGSLETADNGGGSVETFRAVVGDDNAEGDLAGLVLLGQGPERFELRRAFAPEDLEQRHNPGYGADGWAVWDATPQDGLVQAAVRFTYPYAAGTGDYDWTLTVDDVAGLRGEGEPDLTVVAPVHVVEVEGAVDPEGAPASAEGWGGWSAAPGAEHVASKTFLKVVNKGTAPGQRFLVDFTSREFIGAQDRSWRVPLDGNVRFAAWEASPGQAPGEGTFTFGATSPDGSATFQ